MLTLSLNDKLITDVLAMTVRVGCSTTITGALPGSLTPGTAFSRYARLLAEGKAWSITPLPAAAAGHAA